MLTNTFFWADYGKFALGYTATCVASTVIFGTPAGVALAFVLSGLGTYPLAYFAGRATDANQPTTPQPSLHEPH